MSWNYRIVRKQYKNDQNEVLSTEYFIVEAYYDKNGKVCMITQDPKGPYGEDIYELMNNWVILSEAFKNPILDYDNIPEEGAHNEVYERYDELLDEDGEMRDIDELIKEGKVTEVNWSKDFGLTDEDMEKYHKEQEEKAKNSEKYHNENLVNKSIPEIIGTIIEKYLYEE